MDQNRVLTVFPGETYAKAMAWLQNEKLKGYAVLRKCGIGYKFGPLFADDATVAAELFAALESMVEPGAPLFLDISEPNQLGFPTTRSRMHPNRTVDPLQYSRKKRCRHLGSFVFIRPSMRRIRAFCGLSSIAAMNPSRSSSTSTLRTTRPLPVRVARTTATPRGSWSDWGCWLPVRRKRRRDP